MSENEQRMKLILENIGEGVIVTDIQRHILLSNRMAEEILGADNGRQEFISSNWSDQYEIFYPDEETIFPAQNLPLERALRGESTEDVEIIIKNPTSQEKKHLKVMGRPIKDENNNIIAAIATIRDITKYNELEEALKESELKYRKLIGFKRN